MDEPAPDSIIPSQEPIDPLVMEKYTHRLHTEVRERTWHSALPSLTPALPQLFALGGSNNGVHPHPLSGQPTLPWHQSHFSFHPPPCQASLSSPSCSLEQYNGQMQGHFSSSHGGTIWKERPPLPLSALPLSLVLQLGRTGLSHLPPLRF